MGENDMFKRLISALIAGAAAISCAFTCHAETQMEVVKKELAVPQTIVFLGDSIAAGYGLKGFTGTGSNPAECYGAIIGEQYKKELDGTCEAIQKNGAVSGDTSDDFVKRLESGELDKYLFGSNAVVISIGGNDIMGPALDFLSQDLGLKSQEDIKNFDTTQLAKPSVLSKINDQLQRIGENLTNFKINVPKILSTIRAKTDAVIVFQTVYNPLDSNKSIEMLSNIIGEKITELNNIITSNATNKDGSMNYLVCDVASAFAGKSKEYTNIDQYDIHPNAEGHKVIAKLVDEQVRSKKYSFEQLEEVDKSKSENKMSNTRIYLTIGLFFGGFITLFVIVWVKFKRSQ